MPRMPETHAGHFLEPEILLPEDFQAQEAVRGSPCVCRTERFKPLPHSRRGRYSAGSLLLKETAPQHQFLA